MTTETARRFCPQCGSPNEPDWKFCVSCGTALPALTPSSDESGSDNGTETAAAVSPIAAILDGAPSATEDDGDTTAAPPDTASTPPADESPQTQHPPRAEVRPSVRRTDMAGFERIPTTVERDRMAPDRPDTADPGPDDFEIFRTPSPASVAAASESAEVTTFSTSELDTLAEALTSDTATPMTHGVGEPVSEPVEIAETEIEAMPGEHPVVEPDPGAHALDQATHITSEEDAFEEEVFERGLADQAEVASDGFEAIELVPDDLRQDDVEALDDEALGDEALDDEALEDEALEDEALEDEVMASWGETVADQAESLVEPASAPTEPTESTESTEPSVVLHPAGADSMSAKGPTPVADLDIVVAADRSTVSRLEHTMTTSTSVAQIAVLAAAVFGLATVVLLYLLNLRLDESTTTGNTTRAESIDNWLAFAAQPLMILALIASLVALLRWTTIAYSAAWTSGRTQFSIARRTATLSWPIPIVNLIIPPMAMHGLWKAARHDGARPNPWVVLWPILVGIGAFVVLVAALISPAGVDQDIRANTFSAIGFAVITVGFVCLAVALSSVSDAQRQTLHRVHGPNGMNPEDDLLGRLGAGSN